MSNNLSLALLLIAVVLLFVLCVLLVYLLFSKKLVICEWGNEDLSHRKTNILSNLFSFVAMIVGLIALAITVPKAQVHLAMDYWDVIVAILSILVTALIAWQIYNSIKFEEHVRAAKDAADVAQKAAINMAESKEVLSKYIEETNKKTEENFKTASDQIDKILAKLENAVFIGPIESDDDK